MDDFSLDDLLSGLEAAQEKKSTVRLSDRNVVELVNKLRQLGFLGDELLHTTNGREYITRQRLTQEVSDAVAAAGGRMPLVDLPSQLGVDLVHCERAAAEAVTASPSALTLAQGELLATSYFDSLAVDIDEGLQERGVVVVADVARKFALGMEMLLGALQARMGSGVRGRLEGGVIYTEGYLARVKAQLRGALRGALTPVAVPGLRKDLGLEGLSALSALLPSLVDQLQREGAIDGKMAAGGGSWVPAAFVRSQQAAVRAFYSQNGYITYDQAAKHGVPSAAAFLAAAFADGMPLGAAFVSPGILSQLDAAVEESVSSASWLDVHAVVPSDLSPADAAQLLQGCQAARPPAAHIFAGTCVVAAAFVDGLRGLLLEEARVAARQAHEQRKEAGAGKAGGDAAAAADGRPPASGGKKGGKAAAAAAAAAGEEEGDDEDWSMGRGKGGKKGKGGRKGSKAGGGAAAGGGKQSGGAGQDKGGRAPPAGAASAGTLAPAALAARVLQLHPDLKGAGAEGELVAALVAEVRPALVAEYERVLHDIFTAGADRRRRLRDAASVRLDESHLRLQLLAKGAELFAADEGVSAVLQRHLLRASGQDCVDALLRCLGADVADVAEDGDEAPGGSNVPVEQLVATPMTPAERAGVVRELPPDVAPAVCAAVDALAAAATSAAQFSAAVEAAAQAAGLRLRRLDKKSEPALVRAHGEALAGQAAAAPDAATLLAVAVPLLLVRVRGRCVSLPGRALGAGVEALKEHLPEEQHALLVEFHAAVVAQLKAASDQGSGGELEAMLDELVPRVKQLLAV